MQNENTCELEKIARCFHALGDPMRLKIIACLLENEQCVCDLTKVLDTAQSRLSFHLKTLKEAGILLDRREGRWIYYSINPETLAMMEKFVGRFKGSCCRPSEIIPTFLL